MGLQVSIVADDPSDVATGYELGYLRLIGNMGSLDTAQFGTPGKAMFVVALADLAGIVANKRPSIVEWIPTGTSISISVELTRAGEVLVSHHKALIDRSTLVDFRAALAKSIEDIVRIFGLSRYSSAPAIADLLDALRA